MRPETYVQNKPPITERVKRVRALTGVSIRQHKSPYTTHFDAITGDNPLIVRKALSEAAKLHAVPKHLWRDQLFAGSYAFPEPALILNGAMPEYATKEELEVGAAVGFSPATIFGHVTPDYPRLLEKGVLGILRDIEEKRALAREVDSLAFYEACAISLRGLLDFADQYAAVCRDAAGKQEDPKRAQELLMMAGNLMASPRNPPKTFHQALQAVWITHLAYQLTGNNLSVGRADQYLFPFLQADLTRGTLTVETAQELCDLLFLKFNERALDNEINRLMTDIEGLQKKYDEAWANRTIFDRNQQKFNVRDSIDATNHWLQNILLCGIRPDGTDGCNLLSAMMLESFDRMHMTHPVFNVRIGKSTPDWCMQQIAGVLRGGGGSPCIYNEDTLIEAMSEQMHADISDIRDFANNGCWEVLIPGRTDFYFFRFNLLKAMERVLNHGRSWIDGKQEVPDPGNVDGYSFEDLLAAIDTQIALMCKGMALQMKENFMSRHLIAPMPLLSAILDGPIESGRDMTAGGAKYVLCGFVGEGLSHLIDSLVAIKTVVFDRKDATLPEVITAIGVNFQGKEVLRKRLMSCPHYGAGDPQADEIGRAFIARYSEMVRSISEESDQIEYMAGVGTFGWFLASGEATGPTADGRLSGEPLASNASPTSGVMQRGITGAIRSYAALQPEKFYVGGPLDLALSGRSVDGPEGIDRIVGILRSFVALRGCMMTITVGDADVYRRAQQEPEKYRDLRVRMGGWSAYFTMLSKAQQEYHIRKAESGSFYSE